MSSEKHYTKTGYWIKDGKRICGTCDLSEVPYKIEPFYQYHCQDLIKWFNYLDEDWYYASINVRPKREK